MVRYEGGFSTSTPDEDDLTALAEAVREAGFGDRAKGREDTGVSAGEDARSVAPPTVRTGRRGHLRVLPDPSA
jgi:hypothetical protein